MVEGRGQGKERGEDQGAEIMIEEGATVEGAGVEIEIEEIEAETGQRGREERGPGGRTSIGGGKKEIGRIEGEGREKGKGKERRRWLGSCERKRGKLRRKEETMRKGEPRERKGTVKWG